MWFPVHLKGHLIPLCYETLVVNWQNWLFTLFHQSRSVLSPNPNNSAVISGIHGSYGQHFNQPGGFWNHNMTNDMHSHSWDSKECQISKGSIGSILTLGQYWTYWSLRKLTTILTTIVLNMFLIMIIISSTTDVIQKVNSEPNGPSKSWQSLQQHNFQICC